LANLTGLPAEGLSIVSGSIPSPPAPKLRSDSEYMPAIQAAYVNARSKFQVAFGDARKLYRPRVSFNFQYDRYATFNNYQDYYKPGSFRTDNFTVGTVVDLPIFQLQLRAKAKESLADALHAQSDADRVKLDFLEGRVKTINTLAELNAKSEIAALEREIAGQQLDALRIQLNNGSGNGAAPPSPKDEQNALIQERQKYLDLLDADRQLREAQISALRLTGQLEEWLKTPTGR
ncbi:TolC family protein, partial [Terriglobus sp. YAF25]